MKLSIAASLTFAAIMASAAVAPAHAQGDVCFQLWVARNSIYKDAGYCFKTQQGISYFGNADCMYDSEATVPLSRGDRGRISNIQARERQYGCR